MKSLLFPHRFQKPALIGCLACCFLIFLNLQYNLEFSFLATKPDPEVWLSNDNLTDEVFFTGFLLSLTIYGFSREADEDEFNIALRFRSLLLAVLFHTLISLVIINFSYGWAFPFLAVYHLFTVLILYVLFYKGQRFFFRLRALRS